MAGITVPYATGPEVSDALFGGNFLANSYFLGGVSGVEALIDDLGVDGLRYPGGSLTERLFDITDPDSPVVSDAGGATQAFVPISTFLEYAGANGHSVTIVIPTRDFLSKRTDDNGDRYPAFNEAELREFVSDVASGRYGDAEIAAFEIGNEYWGSGEMSAVEYGRLSSRMADIISDELDLVKAPDIDVVVQAGTNHGTSNLSAEYENLSTAKALAALNAKYGTDLGESVVFPSGEINWRAVNDELILREFSPEEGEAVDGAVTHLYSSSHVSGVDRDFALNQVNAQWGDAFEDIDLFVTEWNVSASSNVLQTEEDYGLRQAHEMLNMFESMVEAGVDQANVWPLLQNTRNALSTGREFQDLSPAGEMFSLMSSALPGKRMLDFSVNDADETEFQGRDGDLHGFYGDGELVLYVVSTAEQVKTLSFNLDSMLLDHGDVSGTLLGVSDGDAPGATKSDAVIEDVPAGDFYDEGQIAVTLDPGEILEIRITNFTATDEFASVMHIIDTTSAFETPEREGFEPAEDLVFIDPEGYPGPDEPDSEEAEDPSEWDDWTADLGWLWAFLPLLAIAGLAI